MAETQITLAVFREIIMARAQITLGVCREIMAQTQLTFGICREDDGDPVNTRRWSERVAKKMSAFCHSAIALKKSVFLA